MSKFKSSNFWTYILLVFSMALWGGSFVFTPIVFKTLDPFTTIWSRLAISVVFMLPLLLIFFRKEIHFEKKDIGRVAILALFQPFLYFIGEHLALERVDSITTSLLVSTIPVFTAIAVWLFYKKSLSRVNLIGILLSFIGVTVMIINDRMELSVSVEGLLLLLLAIVTAVGYGLLLHDLVERINIAWLIFFQNLFGLIYFTPVMLIFGHGIGESTTSNFAFLTPNQEFWVALLILGILCSSLNYVFFGNAIKRIGLTRTVVFDNLTPVFATITAFLVLGQSITLRVVVGVCIVITGVMLTQKKGVSQK